MASKVRFDDWMSDADAALWHVERDPALRSTILSLMLLDQPPDETRFTRTLDHAIAHIPRLRQRVVQDALELAPPRWEDDPHFDSRFHIRHAGLAGAGTLRDLLDLAEPIAMHAFDKDRPLWELYLVRGLAGGRAAVLMKLHHAVSDGVGLVRMTSALIERSRDADPKERAEPPPKATRRRERDRLRDALGRSLEQRAETLRRLASRLGDGVQRLAREPVAFAEDARELAGSLARLLRPASEPLSPLWRERGMALRLNALDVPLVDLQRAARAVDCSVNDAFVAAVAGGLRIYHEQRDARVDELRMMMPINMREEGEKGRRAGNQFVPTRFLVPIGIADPRERMRAIQDRVREQRSERALPYFDEISGALNVLPRPLSLRIFGGMVKATDFVTSNVPGPRFPVFMSGAAIERMIPYGPPAGAAVNVTLFSYNGSCAIGVNADRAAIPDADDLTECLRKGIEEITGTT